MPNHQHQIIAIPNNIDDAKIAATTKPYYAVRKCDSLQSPAIFTSWYDFSVHVFLKKDDGKLEYQLFATLQEATNYIENEEDDDNDDEEESLSLANSNYADDDVDEDDKDDEDEDEDNNTRRSAKTTTAVGNIPWYHASSSLKVAPAASAVDYFESEEEEGEEEGGEEEEEEESVLGLNKSDGDDFDDSNNDMNDDNDNDCCYNDDDSKNDVDNDNDNDNYHDNTKDNDDICSDKKSPSSPPTTQQGEIILGSEAKKVVDTQESGMHLLAAVVPTAPQVLSPTPVAKETGKTGRKLVEGREKQREKEKKERECMDGATLDDVIVDEQKPVKVGRYGYETTCLQSIKGVPVESLTSVSLRRFCSIHSIVGYKSQPKSVTCDLIAERVLEWKARGGATVTAAAGGGGVAAASSREKYRLPLASSRRLEESPRKLPPLTTSPKQDKISKPGVKKSEHDRAEQDSFPTELERPVPTPPRNEEATTPAEAQKRQRSSEEYREKVRQREKKAKDMIADATMDDVNVDKEKPIKLSRLSNETTNLQSIKGIPVESLTTATLRHFCSIHKIYGYKSQPKAILCNLIEERIRQLKSPPPTTRKRPPPSTTSPQSKKHARLESETNDDHSTDGSWSVEVVDEEWNDIVNNYNDSSDLQFLNSEIQGAGEEYNQPQQQQAAGTRQDGWSGRIIAGKRAFQWEQNFNLLKEYKSRYGHCRVPTSKNSKEYKEMDEKFQVLVEWLHTQQKKKNFMYGFLGQQKIQIDKNNRNNFATARETQIRLQRLDNLMGSDWHNRCDRWEKNFALLVEYKQKYGHTHCPGKDSKMFKHIDEKFRGLYEWLRQQRKRRKRHLLSKGSIGKQGQQQISDNGNARQLQRLEELIGPDALDLEKEAEFHMYYDMLKKYKEENGHVSVTKSNPELRKFVHRMKLHMQKYKEDPEKYKNEAKGWILDETKYKQLTEELGLTGIQRNKNMSVANKDAPSWEELYDRLCLYKLENGNLDVPSYPRTLLRNWIVHQRTLFERLKEGGENNKAASILTPDRIAKLTSIGFSFKPKMVYLSFEERAIQFLQYKQEHNGRDPPGHLEGGLGSWVQKVRRYYSRYKKGEQQPLTKDQFDKLDSWGFVWDLGIRKPEVVTPPKSWDQRYQELLAYRAKHANVNVPQKYGVLGHWVHSQRRDYAMMKQGKKSPMNQYRLQKLQEVDFVFLTRERQKPSEKHVEPTFY